MCNFALKIGLYKLIKKIFKYLYGQILKKNQKQFASLERTSYKPMLFIHSQNTLGKAWHLEINC